mgnify:CR=1 FL=1
MSGYFRFLRRARAFLTVACSLLLTIPALAQGMEAPQMDLPRSTKSGLRHALEVLQGVDGLSFNFFESKDVVRHPVVARIVQAYEAFDAQQAAEKSASNTRNENTSKESAQ